MQGAIELGTISFAILLIGFIISIFSVAFNIYRHFKNPTETLKEQDAKMLSKILLLEQQISAALNTERLITNLRDNHIHTIESKIDRMEKDVSDIKTGMAGSMGRLEALVSVALSSDKKTIQ